MQRVLIADDERNIRSTVSTTLALEGYAVATAEHGMAALEAVGRGGIDLLLLDLQMPLLDGIETLRRLRDGGNDLPVIFLSAHGSIERAVEAVKLGAFDFIEKPPHAERILLAVRNALRQSNLEDENRRLRAESDCRFEMIGSSASMRELFDKIDKTAPTQARVLILGENGTGKELIARALHRNSPRRDRPFVRVNCAAIPRDLFESELFGHERGAFTGATVARKGRFRRADGGTLFLDEVAEIPSELQAKLLRALESGEVEPVGAEREVQVDVRVLSATNQDLQAAVAAGRFRRDLYYRLNVVTLQAPPLRDRKSDLPALTEAFVDQARREHNLPPRKLTAGAMKRLAAHDYPGNVRELRNIVERMLILANGEAIDDDAVARSLPVAEAAPVDWTRLRGSLRETLAEVERALVLGSLERNDWKMTASARELGLERSHLYKKLQALGIDKRG